jgi:hypothetical protein
MNPYDNAYDPNGQEPELEAGRVAVPDQKKNVAVAAGGTAVLAASAIGLTMLDDGSGEGEVADAYDYKSDVTTETPIVQVASTGNGGINSMKDIDDADTFDKAFAAARHLVGPGHHFTWHGNVYNTYYQEELTALSPAERQAFIASLDGQQVREVSPAPAAAMPAHHTAPAPRPQHHDTTPMLADEEAPADATGTNVPEIVPMAAAVGAADAYPEITPVGPAAAPTVVASTQTGMGPHIESEEEYMGHQPIGHDDVADHYDQAHDQLNGHDIGLHTAE